MSQATQQQLLIPHPYTNPGFKATLDYIRKAAKTEHKKGELFERLMVSYFTEDPDYKDQFSEVYLWQQWAELRTEFDGTDIGIDLVAKKHDGTFCAIQCKCYAEETRINKPHIDTFLSASASDIFTSWIFVHTGGEIGVNAQRTIDPLGGDFRVIHFSDLESSPFEWPDLSLQDPEALTYKQRKFALKDHQREALEDVINGFKNSDRGKLIMACGTGKTFIALKIAEHIAGIAGRVLYLVPSISLLSQAMREWSDQRGVPHSYIGICSDTRAGDRAEDTSVQELKIPVTTEPVAITHSLQNTDTEKMTVVFCTYQSLPLIEKAQDAGAPPFDLILCDEAHRTTGIDNPGDKTSPFVLVHNAQRIRANKRLYMTATPKVYTDTSKTNAAKYGVDVFSMDNEEKYGTEFHRLPFSKAVELGELSDYKVVILAISEQEVNTALSGDTGRYGSEININDATRIVGCYRALQNPDPDNNVNPLKRVILFTNRINESKAITREWNNVVQDAIEKLPEDEIPAIFECENKHVDGTDHALNRKARLDWLKGGDDDTCRILSNARCLSEGVDVPALDAVIFFTPRKSQIDVVQAVGRVMRKAQGKDYGYVILPVAIPDSRDPAAALDDNERFKHVWSVLNALRSHDERLDAQINSIDLNNALPNSIITGGSSKAEDNTDQIIEQLPLMPMDIPIEAILPKIVEKCGDRKYWESWAKDIALIFKRIVDRMENILQNPENDALKIWFDDFHQELKEIINDTITRQNAIDMMAQHIITAPVFEALFENYDFTRSNPIANALDKLQKDFAEFGLENETRDLIPFYESVQKRASNLNTSEARQKVLLELYETFFKTAMKKEVDKLGIVYTPIEVVDFILHSANEVLQNEFGHSLSDKDVHIFDPFTGTGTFLTRLLQSDIIKEKDLKRKYKNELHANEIVPLAYYIATVNIEETYRGKRDTTLDKGEDLDVAQTSVCASVGSSTPTDKEDKRRYEPFNGIVLTDTFNLPNKEDEPTLFSKQWLPVNNERAEKQQKMPIQVIIGNPPWRAGQKKADDNNPKVSYPELEKRVKETYATRYDYYKMALRWASDRIGEQGIIAFVTNGSWLDGNVDAGVRACFEKEFSSIHVLNLRGNQRTQGERSRREGGKIFGSGSRAPVAITILVKNPNKFPSDKGDNPTQFPLDKGDKGGSAVPIPSLAGDLGGKIFYKDIGDYLTREEKLNQLREAKSISGFTDWQNITPDKHFDWIEQRSEAFTTFYPMGTKETKAKKADNAIFELFSNGYKTGRDAYIYNFSRNACAENAEKLTQDYLAAISELEENPERSVAEIAKRHTKNSKWDDNLKSNLKRKKKTDFDNNYIRKVLYRPYVATNCYADYTFAQVKAKQDIIFPQSFSENRVICVTDTGTKTPFSALTTDIMPDLGLNLRSQCFPRWQYQKSTDTQNILFSNKNNNGGGSTSYRQHHRHRPQKLPTTLQRRHHHKRRHL